MSKKTDEKKKKLLVILLDGFRWDYFDKPGLKLPGFKQLFEHGVKADYMVPDFPSLSLPNYQSVMTGLHVEDHGFVGNHIYDEERNTTFEYLMLKEESNKSYWFEGGEPLWITAVKQEKRTYMFEWPGAHLSNHGLHSTFYDAMTEWPEIPHFRANLRTALSMFQQDKIDMAGVFLDTVDRIGHWYGPNSKEMEETLVEVDSVIKEMMETITSGSIENDLNIVIFSDHGMTDISESRTVDISDHLGQNDVHNIQEQGPICSIWPKDGKVKKVYSGLTGMKNEHIKVYKKEDIPERWRYKNHRLVAPITVVADSGWYILPYADKGIYKSKEGPLKGFHGYDNVKEDMRSIFIAGGPAFKKNYKTGPVKAVDLYQVMCKCLDIQPSKHKGTWSSVKDIFKDVTEQLESK